MKEQLRLSIFLNKKEIPKRVKSNIIKRIVNKTFACKSWTLLQKQRSRLISAEMRFLKRIKRKTRKVNIRNQL